jgi:RNA polymerase sigma factor (sigma-70 family)
VWRNGVTGRSQGVVAGRRGAGGRERAGAGSGWAPGVPAHLVPARAAPLGRVLVSDDISADWGAEMTECFVTMSGPLYDFMYLFTRCERALAEDLVQEAFQEAWKNWHELRPPLTTPDQLLKWLRRVAARRAVDGYRHNTVVRKKQPQVWDRYRPRAADTEAQALSAVAVERCWDVIACMPERQHQIALLYWRCRWTGREIAEALAITEGAVTAQIAAARKKLCDALGSEIPPEFGQAERGGGGHE